MYQNVIKANADTRDFGGKQPKKILQHAKQSRPTVGKRLAAECVINEQKGSQCLSPGRVEQSKGARQSEMIQQISRSHSIKDMGYWDVLDL